MATLSNNIDLTALYDDCDMLAALYRDELMAINAVASGNLVRFTTDVTYDGNAFHFIFNLPQYYGAIEEGRKPTVKSEGGVLYQAIRRWIDMKGIVPRDGKSKDSLAHAITTKIHKLGFFGMNHSGKHPLAKAMAKARSQGLINEITNEIAQQLGKEIKVDLSDLNNRTSLK